MTTFTKEITFTDVEGNSHTLTHTYRKMDEKTFKHYSENPLGMDEVVRKEMGIPDNKYYTVSMWPVNEFAGVVRVIPNVNRTVSATKISKSSQSH